jgi:hypothetical protein
MVVKLRAESASFAYEDAVAPCYFEPVALCLLFEGLN